MNDKKPKMPNWWQRVRRHINKTGAEYSCGYCGTEYHGGDRTCCRDGQQADYRSKLPTETRL